MSDLNRISIKYKRPNPLFEKWLTKWRDEAKQNDSKMQYCFSNALQSLRRYPLPLETGKDCKILKGFGDKLCNMLDAKLKEHKTDEGMSLEKPNTSSKSEKISNYVPQFGSGAYAILVTIYKSSLDPDYPGFMKKADIIKDAQSISNTSFTKPDPGSYYTAWSSMKILISKNLITKQSSPAKFSLTESGIQLAMKLYNSRNIQKNTDESTNKPISEENFNEISPLVKDGFMGEQTKLPVIDTNNVQSQSSHSTTSSSSSESIIFAPYSFEIVLCVDTQETCGNKVGVEDPFLSQLRNLGVNFEVKNLKVGDYIWICRNKSCNVDLVLPYIVERKRMDDFASSIKDGRYYEQKFRLKRSGIKNITYLIESYGKNDTHVGLPLGTLYQAATNTAIQDDFFIKFSENMKGTAIYLANFTEFLTKIFKEKTIVSCGKDDLPEFSINDEIISTQTFNEFNQSSVKNKKMTVKNLFVKLLIQIKGMSVEKALGIVDKYPTPVSLFKAYEENPGVNGEKLLSNIQFGKAKKNIGLVLSKTVFQLFTTQF